MRNRIVAITLAIGLMPLGAASAAQASAGGSLEAMSCKQLQRHERVLFKSYKQERRIKQFRGMQSAIMASGGSPARAGAVTGATMRVGLTILPKASSAAARTASPPARMSPVNAMRAFREQQATLRASLWRKGCAAVRPLGQRTARVAATAVALD